MGLPGIFLGQAAVAGLAHAISLDVCPGHPARRACQGNIASPSRLRSVSSAAPLARAHPASTTFPHHTVSTRTEKGNTKGGVSDPAGASCHGNAGQGQGDRTPGSNRRPRLHTETGGLALRTGIPRRQVLGECTWRTKVEGLTKIAPIRLGKSSVSGVSAGKNSSFHGIFGGHRELTDGPFQIETALIKRLQRAAFCGSAPHNAARDQPPPTAVGEG